MRNGVGVIILNKSNKIFVGKRKDNPIDKWQMPQGGLNQGEDYLSAMKRELYEETSIKSIKVIKEIDGYFEYTLPKTLVGIIWKGKYRGQKQKWFITKFLTRPMYVFGFVGIISILISLAMSSYLIVLKIMGEDIGNRPLLMFALILGIAGVQLFSFGLLSELLIRTYHESQSRPIYRIRSISSANKN